MRMVFSQLARQSTHMLISGVFKQLKAFVPDILSGFSRIIGGVFFFRYSVRCQYRSEGYS